MKKGIVLAGLAAAIILMLAAGGRSEVVELPDKLARAVPAYQGATVVSSMQMGTNWHAVLETDDSPRKVITFYKDALTRKGWGVSMEIFQPESAALGLGKDDQQLMIGAESSKDKTSISLSLIQQ